MPLFLAVHRGSLEVVEVLLSYNPDLELTTPYGETALIAAIDVGNHNMTRLLLEAGADINCRTRWNHFPLQYAVQRNKEDVVRLLLEYNPYINIGDDDGNTALHYICSYISVTLVRRLVNRGADVNIRNKTGDTPICKAVRFKDPAVLYYPAKKSKLDFVGGTCGSPLHIACHLSKLHLVKFLLNVGADVNLADPTLGTPLQLACHSLVSTKEEQESVIFFLINEAKANINIVRGLYGTAFNAACAFSSYEVVGIMLEKGASMDVEDDMGRVATYCAAARSMEIFFRVIFEVGADVELVDKMGRTALHRAPASGIDHIVDYIILMSGGLVDQPDRDDWTPLLWAARGCNIAPGKVSSSAQWKVIELLFHYGADPCVAGKGLDRDWSPAKIARYHGVDGKVIRLLEEKAKEKLNNAGGLWDEESHASRQADRKSEWCDSCLVVSTLLLVSPAVHASAQWFS